MVYIPSRYEDLKAEFRERLKPIPELLRLVKEAYTSISTSGGIRFLPIFGVSGSGKSCASLEIASHIPNCHVYKVPPDLIADRDKLEEFVKIKQRGLNSSHLLVLVIDQYEEQVASRGPIPSQIIEHLSLFDRGYLRFIPTLFIWLTTSIDFQQKLVDSTSRDSRILVHKGFKLEGPRREEWPDIITETFQFHNANQSLADYNILTKDLFDASTECETLGAAIESIGIKAGQFNQRLMDLSEYMVIMLWPVTNNHRTALVNGFSDARNGYTLDWNGWFKLLNAYNKARFPLHQLNRTRLYFDVRLIPIPAANIVNLCKNIETDQTTFRRTYLSSFMQTHFYSIISGGWRPERYTPIQIGDSIRAIDAAAWYESITSSPTQLGKRLSRVLQACGRDTKYEYELQSPHGRVRPDIYIEAPKKLLIELKVYSPYNTTNSRISHAIGTTLRKYAQFSGFSKDR